MVSDTLLTIILSAYLSSAGDYAALYQGSIEPQFAYTSWNCHPYWSDDQFHIGNISYNGVLYQSVPIRYNIYDNRLSVLSPGAKIPIVPKPESIDYLEIEGDLYVRANGWFMLVEYMSDNFAWLTQRTKLKSTDILVDNHYLSEMRIVENHYIRLSDGSLHRANSLKELVSIFPEQKSKLHQEIRHSNLSFSKKKRYASLLQCVAFIDQNLEPVKDLPKYEEKTGTNAVISSHVLDSLFSEVQPATRVPAYVVYSQGDYSGYEFADDAEGGNNPGIENLDVMRESHTLDEVEVVGFNQKVSQLQAGMESFRPSLLKNVPLAMGESDVLKLATMLPGVSTTGEASSGINVRGGASDQNLMLYNGNTLYNPMHMFGIVSALNSDLIAETELFKGGIPSQYGGRLSSVLNIKGKAADKQAFHGSASIGLITAKGMFEVPIVKDKVSLLLGGRTTYSDWMLKKLPAKSGYSEGSAGFWDLGGSLHSLINRRNSLVFNGYYSSDRFAFNKYQEYGYHNMNFSTEWKGRIGSDWQTSLTAAYDHYDYYNDDSEVESNASRLSFELDQYTVKASLAYQLNDDHSLSGGVQGVYYHIMPGTFKPLGEFSLVSERSLDDDNAYENALYVEDTWNVFDNLKLNGGVRVNLFLSQKEGMKQTYVAPDIRLSGSWNIDENQSVKAGFNTLHQYIHKVSNTVIMSPTDSWLLSNSEIKPQNGWQLSGGYYWRSDDMLYEASAETYYKGMDNYLTYRSAAQLIMNSELHKDVIGVEGRAYGLELQLRKLTGRFNGWISYTYSRTQLRQKDGNMETAINRGEWFSADYDVPHSLKVASNFKFTRRYSMSLNADYSTGRPFTGPIGQFYSTSLKSFVPIYSDRNASRMPDYFRLDWSFNVEPSHHITAKTHRWFTMGVYNLLGRKNAYSIYYESERDHIQGYKLSIFGAPIPYINYNIKF